MPESSIVFKCETCKLDNIPVGNSESHEGHVLSAILLDRSKDQKEQLKLLPDNKENLCRCNHNERIHSNYSKNCLYSRCKCNKFIDMPPIPSADELVRTFVEMMGDKVFLTIRKDDVNDSFNVGFWLKNQFWTSVKGVTLTGALLKAMTELIKSKRSKSA